MVKILFIAVFAIALVSVSAIPAPDNSDISLESISTRDILQIPSYAKWCGPKYTELSEKTFCATRVECACKEFALCYRKHGFGSCKCDLDFVKNLKNSHPLDDGKAVKEKGITVYSLSPCKAPLDIPYIKQCRECTKIFGQKICITVPCGVGTRCKMVDVLIGKQAVTKYSC